MLCGFIKNSSNVYLPLMLFKRVDSDSLTSINSDVGVSPNVYHVFQYSVSTAAGNKYAKIYIDNVLNYQKTTDIYWTDGLITNTISYLSTISYNNTAIRLGEIEGFAETTEMSTNTATAIYTSLKNKWGL